MTTQNQVKPAAPTVQGQSDPTAGKPDSPPLGSDASQTGDGARLSPESLQALFEQAHTTRVFLDEPAPVAQVRNAYSHARWAPTQFNVQPMRIDLFENREARAELAELMAEGNKHVVENAPLTLLVSADHDFHHMIDHLGAPGKVVQMFAENPEMRASVAQNNAWLQLGYLVTTLRAEGLDVSVMSGADFPAIDAKYHSDNGWKAIAVVNVGHSAGAEAGATRPRAGRFEFNQITQNH